MKHLILLSVAIAWSLCGSAQNVYEIDSEKSSIAWLAKKVTGQHNGLIYISDGQLSFDDEERLTGGIVNIDMTSIVVEDIENKKMNDKLVGHLKSSDFFDAEQFNTASFFINEVIYSDQGIAVKGDMTIKGITNEQIMNVEIVNEGSEEFVAKTTFEIDRTLYNVRYGSGKFFENLGDKTIYDNFALSIDISVKK